MNLRSEAMIAFDAGAGHWVKLWSELQAAHNFVQSGGALKVEGARWTVWRGPGNDISFTIHQVERLWPT